MLPSSKNKASKGCWTCKDRKVRCDLGLPSCANCARVQQVCQGYGMRLSWPKDGDTKRFITGSVPGSPAGSSKYTEIELIHTSFFDMEMYHYLVELRSSRVDNKLVLQPANLILPLPLPFKPANLNAEEQQLLQYFQSTAFLSLATCSTSAVIIRDALVRIAVANHTIPSRAVLHALLALSSLHRDGEQLQATQHKTAAVGALGASAKNGIRTTAEAAQHVAANMLLCSFETYRGSDFHGHWPWYLMGAKEISKAASLESHISQTDIRELVLWTFYHDILARFSLFHWRQESVLTFLTKGLGIGAEWQRNICAFAAELELDLGPLPRILRYLGDTVRALCKSVNSPVSSRDFQEEVHAAERGVLSVPELPTPPTSSTNEEARSFAALTELYRTAVLVYIARICENKFCEFRDLSSLVNKGFAQIEQFHTCERLFPIFILGCEADTDERRIVILNLLKRTETTQVRSLHCIRRGLNLLWTQDDLHADHDLKHDYINKLSVVVSSGSSPPTFV